MPTVAQVKAYIESGGNGSTWSDDDIASALSSESVAQARKCRTPAEGAPWPADLSEALCRRVVVNLSMRSKPLGLESSVSEVGVGFARVGGRDAEVNRLEAPYRRLVVG